MNIPALRTERLLFRALRAEDRAPFLAMFEDEGFRRHLGPRRTAGELWMRALGGRGMWSVHGMGFWAVEDRGGFAGHVGIGDFCRDFDLPGPEVGWMLAPRTWRRGYATEAVAKILEWADEQGHRRTCALIDPGNAASARVAEKCGFTLTGEVDLNGTVNLFERTRQ